MATGTALNSAQARGHIGHSHGHGHHHHDNTYLTSKNKNDPGVRITRIGLYVNLGMAIAKGIGGYAFNSQALTADAIHSLTDLVSDITTLATISYSLRPPTTRFPFGYGKIESLGSLGVSGFLLTGGIMIGLQAVIALANQFFPELAHILSELLAFGHGHSHSHSHGAEDFGPNINAAWLAAGSIVLKEWLYRATMKVAREKRSSLLASNAYHHRVDSLTAFVALLTISASNIFSGAQWLDPIGGLLISGMVVQAGYGNTKAALLEIADQGVDDEVKQPVEKAVREVLGDFEGMSDKVEVQGVKSGQNFLVEVAVSAPDSWTLGQMKEVENRIREKVVKSVRGTKRVAVKFANTTEEHPFASEFVTSEQDLEEHGHDPEHDHDHSHEHEHKSGSDQTNGDLTKRR